MLFHLHRFIANVLSKVNILISSVLREGSYQTTGFNFLSDNEVSEMEMERKWCVYYERENFVVIIVIVHESTNNYGVPKSFSSDNTVDIYLV